MNFAASVLIFHIHVSVNMNIYRNRELGRTVSFLGIFVSNFVIVSLQCALSQFP
jgi:hypothetical protein